MRELNSDKFERAYWQVCRGGRPCALVSASDFNVLVKIAVKEGRCTANVQFIQLIRHSDPIRSLIRPAMSVEGSHPHADAGHQSAGRDANFTEAEDFADAVREYAVARRLIELTTLEVFVLHDQALGGARVIASACSALATCERFYRSFNRFQQHREKWAQALREAVGACRVIICLAAMTGYLSTTDACS